MCVFCVIHSSCQWEFNFNLSSHTGPKAGRSFISLSLSLCANILSISLLQAEYFNKIKGVKMGMSGISFTHLFFADDSLLFFKNDRNSLGNIQSILNWYYSISGQKINLAKFDLFCSPNVANKCQVSIARSLNVNFCPTPQQIPWYQF